jgi:hypothetical protein
MWRSTAVVIEGAVRHPELIRPHRHDLVIDEFARLYAVAGVHGGEPRAPVDGASLSHGSHQAPPGATRDASALVLQLLPSFAGAADPVILVPTSPWHQVQPVHRGAGLGISASSRRPTTPGACGGRYLGQGG